MDEDAAVFDPEDMVPFDEHDTFHAREIWDERYNVSVNLSTHDNSTEILLDGKRAEVRLQTGDLITDHIVRLLSHGQELEPKAIAAQMAATNWTPPRGWHIPPQDERQELPLHEALDGAY
jgi:hypothetical protein